jgi:hypothetical protein
LFYRRVIKFLDSESPGCYHQKALDIRCSPTLPKHIMLYRARGVEEMEGEVRGEQMEEVRSEQESDEEEEVEPNYLNQAMTSHGDP